MTWQEAMERVAKAHETWREFSEINQGYIRVEMYPFNVTGAHAWGTIVYRAAMSGAPEGELGFSTLPGLVKQCEHLAETIREKGPRHFR